MTSVLNSIDSVDGAGVLLKQLEKEALSLCSDIKDGFAFIGLCFIAKKIITGTYEIVEAVQVHVIGTNLNLKEQFGPWAVITGSSEGIGRAYAEELAKAGLNIVLMSYDEPALKIAKYELETQYEVDVCYIVADFAVQNQTDLYFGIQRKLETLNVGLLVNNVGVMYDHPDVLLNVSPDKLWQLIHVNIGAATMMTHMLLPQMVKRRKGGIVALTSGTSTQITPQMTVYSATKRYLDYFMHGIAFEYRKSGVVFQCLAPFYVKTRMNSYSKTLSKASFFIPTAQTYASHAVSTLGQSLHTTGYYPHTLLLWISRNLPSSIWMWGSEVFNSSLRRQALQRNLKTSSTRLSSNVTPWSPHASATLKSADPSLIKSYGETLFCDTSMLD